MPKIVTKDTPREDITIAEKTFSVPMPYVAGHQLTEGEADQLNQVLHENIRNNYAKKVKDAVTGSTFDQATMQSELDDYSVSYEFGVRSGGGRISDPIEREAMTIAKELVKAKIREKGGKVADYKAADITELAEGVVARYPEIMEQARIRVEAAKSSASDLLAKLELGPAKAA
jgi:hypothetical protein